ncbi:MAG: BON domain-containing protein [Steroidobacteraceae bacterium]
MKTDAVVKQDVETELRWSPEVDDTDIATKVRDGIVMLTGYACSYFEKHQAELAVKRVAGVAAIVNDLQVRPAAGAAPTDPEIARAALAALKGELPELWQSIRPTVHEGRIFLEGHVQWQFQRQQAESAVRRVPGIMGVRNSIELAPSVEPKDVTRSIEAAFRRSAEFDAAGISIEAHGPEVLLRGEVRSWAERDQAQQTAWAAPGVTNVINEIRVRV